MFNLKLIFPGELKVDGPVILKPKGYWTKDGKKMENSDFEGPRGANDVKVYWTAIQFTRDGKPVGNVILPPDGSNDIHIELIPKRKEEEEKPKEV